jgi:hypothetical protein
MNKYKVFHLIDNEYQVVEFNPDIDDYDSATYQGSLSDCEAWIRLTENDML